MKKYILATLMIASLGLVLVASTASADTCEDLKGQFEQNGGANVVAPLPKYCSTGQVYTKIINTALASIGVAAVAAGVYGGFLYVVSRGDEKVATKGRQILSYGAIGVLCVLGAAALVNIVIQLAVNNTIF